jgi:hypothetical protein
VLLVALAGCSRCDDDCDDGTCITYNPTTSTSDGGDSGSTDEGEPPTTDAATSDTGSDPGTDSSTGMPDDGQCQGTDECDGQFCVAPYADNVRGMFACVAECVGPMEETKWCFDDAACCDAAAHCTIRGYCEVEGETTSTTAESTGDASSSGTG